MRPNLPLQRRRAARKPAATAPSPRRARQPRRHGLRTRCGYLLFVNFV